ncbi:MAG: TIGR03085 family metal-binding protein [Corynebacterium sp.]|uniref:TIGR03085 family metal-binding protein n=1 Tax=Corynebacterium sp. TaxID=1720 RepID=UPI0026DBA791|nr:TIGR03085 family metal-binding protein [Corynebacterium sp.]MDO5029242.1 TIGR03085 family metal-binding protein [Corynebacterium sp.]
MTFAEQEREALANLLLAVGPNAPTLCEGWTTRDLANHLYIRENRPDAAGGMFVKALTDRLNSVTAEVDQMPYAEVVGKWGSGAPKWNPMKWADKYVNTVENFVHHEDVRRAQEGWTVRQLPPSAKTDLWKMVTTSGRMMLRGSTSTVVFMRDDGVAATLVDNSDKSAPVVTVSGSVGELVLWLYGRDEVRVTIDGDESGIKRNSI